MSTNFYWIDGTPQDYNNHIGLRSGAGRWCYDCDDTLFAEDISLLHNGTGEWYTLCPECNKEITTTTCSFTWAIDPHDVYVRCCLKAQKIIIRDECGSPYSGVSFLMELRYCKIKYERFIGTEFS